MAEKEQKMDKMEKAKKIAARKLDFLRHFFIYAAVMAVLAIINNATWRGYQWWLWPALGWGGCHEPGSRSRVLRRWRSTSLVSWAISALWTSYSASLRLRNRAVMRALASTPLGVSR